MRRRGRPGGTCRRSRRWHMTSSATRPRPWPGGSGAGAPAPPAMDLAIIVPAQEMDHPGTAGRDGGGMWPLIYPRLLEMILAHRTTIIFVNSRRLAERVSQQLTELAAATGVAPEGGDGAEL